MAKEDKIYKGEKTTFPVNGTGKTGQLQAKESYWTTFSNTVYKNKLKIY